MPATYEQIASTTLGSATADITFSNIPGTYTDLILVCYGVTNHTGTSFLAAQVNADTGTNYSNTYLFGNGTSAVSGRESSKPHYYLGDVVQSGNSNIAPAITRSHFLSYSNTNVFKTMLSINEGGVYTQRLVNLWRSTAAITSIKIYSSAASLNTGFTASLYGVKAA